MSEEPTRGVELPGEESEVVEPAANRAPETDANVIPSPDEKIVVESDYDSDIKIDHVVTSQAAEAVVEVDPVFISENKDVVDPENVNEIDDVNNLAETDASALEEASTVEEASALEEESGLEEESVLEEATASTIEEACTEDPLTHQVAESCTQSSDKLSVQDNLQNSGDPINIEEEQNEEITDDAIREEKSDERVSQEDDPPFVKENDAEETSLDAMETEQVGDTATENEASVDTEVVARNDSAVGNDKASENPDVNVDKETRDPGHSSAPDATGSGSSDWGQIQIVSTTSLVSQNEDGNQEMMESEDTGHDNAGLVNNVSLNEKQEPDVPLITDIKSEVEDEYREKTINESKDVGQAMDCDVVENKDEQKVEIIEKDGVEKEKSEDASGVCEDAKDEKTTEMEETGPGAQESEKTKDDAEVSPIDSKDAEEPMEVTESLDKAEVKTEVPTSDSAKDKEEDNDVTIIEDDDVKVVDVQGPKNVKKREESSKQNESGDGELSLQIASVSGGVEMPDTDSTQTAETKVSAKTDPGNEEKKKSRQQTCVVCGKFEKCKYNIVRNGDIKHLCDDECFKRFRKNPAQFLRQDSKRTAEQNAFLPQTTSGEQKGKESTQTINNYKTCTVCQVMNVYSGKLFLNWQTLDFCSEKCLGKYLLTINKNCLNCNKYNPPLSGNIQHCTKIGDHVKQYCSAACLYEYRKRQKLCTCCGKDISKNADAFVAPVGKDGVFKDFCSPGCLQKYEQVSELNEGKKGSAICVVCHKFGPIKQEVNVDGKIEKLCSDPCLSVFQFANKLTVFPCSGCSVNLNESSKIQSIQFEGQSKRFCSSLCVDEFKQKSKKVVPCTWCNIKKNNFDMIERVDANNKFQLFCSLNCLSLYRVSLKATSNQSVVCDQCHKYVPAQYHLTMSDASVRNFCSYNCVMTFQAQFTVKQVPVPVTSPPSQKTVIQTTTSNKAAPVTTQSFKVGQPASKAKVFSPLTTTTPGAAKPSQRLVQKAQPQKIAQFHHVVCQPPIPKSLKNKSLLCKPVTMTKATSCKPHTQTKSVQTDDSLLGPTGVIPVPIPYYIPMPLAMYSQPVPVPMPIPIPIPVPCFIPTTRKSATGILKQIKEIQERIPSDPLEAELLMMAEAVAGAQPESDSDTEPENENTANEGPVNQDSEEVSKEVTPATNEFGEDMLQVALRIATEMTQEPQIMDLEASIEPVPVNTEPPKPPSPEESETADEDYVPQKETRGRGRPPKRSLPAANRSSSSRRSKRARVQPAREETPTPPAPAPEAQEEAPDANFHLKYTYGIAAWKHWVVQKNAQLEKASKAGTGRLKLFKTDMLACTADELNFSLCLFVKEVRKPNGEEYNADSIYYLCLGIQQFLFENQRIDNIFTDIYYEKFTECLNEILMQYKPTINTAGQLVCRIEEEHLWECKQLGAHSPHVLLNTLVYFNTKYFMLRTAEDHLKFAFNNISKNCKKTVPTKANSTGRSVYLRYFCPWPTRPNDINKKNKKEEMPVFEQAENLDNPLRCPVKLYEFYVSKCPESVKNRSDVFYLTPERSCVPDSPVWYSTMSLSIDAMNKMLRRLQLVREIQEAMLHSQPAQS